MATFDRDDGRNSQDGLFRATGVRADRFAGRALPIRSTVVIPGRRASVEPGIHLTAAQEAERIPGPRLKARPGMTSLGNLN
jgi:hypothetical protein